MTADSTSSKAASLQVALQREVQRREGTRLMMLFFFFAMLAMLAVVRQVVGCESMQGWALGARVALLFVGILYCTRSLQVVNAADAQGSLLGERYWLSTATFELVLVLAMVTATELLSARDDIQDLSAPILMMIPLLVVLSVLRLRPRATLWTALIGGIYHAGLSLWTFFRVGVPVSELPTLLSYAALLFMIGVAGWLVASEFRAMMLDRVERKRSEPTPPGND
ncbi:MAG: hypothetical protein EBR71_01930 [Planctomycetes bacterium]|nr:hypothetical protein [Planctomycetota bacterium]